MNCPPELEECLKYARLIEIIEKWSQEEQNKWFKLDFVKSVKSQIIQHQKITEKQKEAIDKIVKKCKIL